VGPAERRVEGGDAGVAHESDTWRRRRGGRGRGLRGEAAFWVGVHRPAVVPQGELPARPGRAGHTRGLGKPPAGDSEVSRLGVLQAKVLSHCPAHHLTTQLAADASIREYGDGEVALGDKLQGRGLTVRATSMPDYSRAACITQQPGHPNGLVRAVSGGERV